MPGDIDEFHLAGRRTDARSANCSELRAIALRLLELAERGDASRADMVANPKHVETDRPFRTRSPQEEPTLAFLRSLALFIYGSRRRRAKHFDESMFGEAAWDMLLDLFIHATEGKRVGTQSVCVGSAVPPTTALRWIAAFEEKGWVHREQSANDARVTYVRLSDVAFDAMKGYLLEEISAFAYQKPSSFMLGS